MGIPPHAARLAGAWAVRSTAAGAAADGPSPSSDLQPGLVPEPSGRQPSPGPTRELRHGSSHRITVSRILHPLQRHA